LLVQIVRLTNYPEHIMKKLLIAIAAVLTLGTSLPAFAGVDFQALEHARNAQRAQNARPGNANPQGRDTPTPLVLPLDHGPRAQSTPYLNQQRVARFEARTKFHARS